MSLDERTTELDPFPTTPAFSFRQSSDRCCSNCGEVALAYDVETGRARCRSCGLLD